MIGFNKILLAGICLFGVGCYYDSQEALYNNTTKVACDTTNITYSGKVTTILSANCYICHDATNGPLVGNNIILDNYASLKEQALNGKLMGDMNQKSGFNAMPLGGTKLSDCDIAAIQHWVDLNTPNN